VIKMMTMTMKMMMSGSNKKSSHNNFDNNYNNDNHTEQGDKENNDKLVPLKPSEWRSAKYVSPSVMVSNVGLNKHTNLNRCLYRSSFITLIRYE
jgi:hypothetical protein